MAKEKILLIVEDDEILLRALHIQLKDSGFVLSTATDGELGIQLAQRLKPSVVLLDLVLPKKDGFDVLRDLKADPSLKNIPVIVLSNLGDKKDIDKAMKLGAKEYFVKATTELDKITEIIEKVSNGKNHKNKE